MPDHSEQERPHRVVDRCSNWRLLSRGMATPAQTPRYDGRAHSLPNWRGRCLQYHHRGNAPRPHPPARGRRKSRVSRPGQKSTTTDLPTLALQSAPGSEGRRDSRVGSRCAKSRNKPRYQRLRDLRLNHWRKSQVAERPCSARTNPARSMRSAGRTALPPASRPRAGATITKPSFAGAWRALPR